jgi:lysyl-tRNA synthetase class 2
VVFKTIGYWRFYGVRGTVLKRRRNLSSCLWIDGFGKALKPLPVVKQMNGKTYDAFADQEQRTDVVMWMTVNDHVKETFIKTQII